MPESTSPYTATATAPAAASQVADLLRSQLVSVTEDRRRVMLWSAILAAGSLMLVGRVASLPWFLSLVPLALLTVWQACLLVRQRRYQAAWDSLLEKGADNTGSGSGSGPSAGPTRKAAAAASAQASQELGLGSTPAVLAALAAPSVLLFHGLLLAAVVTGGVMHEVEREKEIAAVAQHEISRGSALKVAPAPAAPGASVRPPAMPPRTFNNASPRPQPAPSNGLTAAPGRPTAPFPANAPRPQPLQPAPAPASGPRSLPPATLRPKPVTSTGAVPSSPAQSAPPAAPPAAPKPAAPKPEAPKPEAPKPEAPAPVQ